MACAAGEPESASARPWGNAWGTFNGTAQTLRYSSKHTYSFVNMLGLCFSVLGGDEAACYEHAVACVCRRCPKVILQKGRGVCKSG